jgi:hypothetical protein
MAVLHAEYFDGPQQENLSGCVRQLARRRLLGIPFTQLGPLPCRGADPQNTSEPHPFRHPISYRPFRAWTRQHACDDSHGVGPGVPADGCVFQRDAANSNEGLRRESANSAEPVNSNRRIGAILRSRPEDGAESDIVDGLGCGGANLVRTVGGVADGGSSADHRTYVRREKILLSQVEATLEKAGVVGAIVEDEVCRAVAAQSGDLFRLGDDFTAPETFVAELEYARASFKERGGCLDGVEAHAFQRDGVDDWVDAR